MSNISIREMPARLFLPMLPSEVGSWWLDDSSYTLVERTRPWVNERGAVSVRLVWRGPDRMSVVVSFRLRGSIPDELLDALACAMMPHVGIDA